MTYLTICTISKLMVHLYTAAILAQDTARFLHPNVIAAAPHTTRTRDAAAMSEKALARAQLAEQLERTAARIRSDFSESGEQELARARAEVAEELRAAADLLQPSQEERDTTGDQLELPAFCSMEAVIHGISAEMTPEGLAKIFGWGPVGQAG